jgi:hypothetical protein
MAKVKLKTSAKLNTSRNVDTGKSTGKSTGRRTGRTRRNMDVEKEIEEKSGKGGVIAIVIMLLLIGGGGGGGYYYYKINNQVKLEYTVTAPEIDALKTIDKKIVNVQLDVYALNSLVSDTSKFQKNFSKPQVVMKDEKPYEFESPNLDRVALIKADGVEGVITAKREKLREDDFKAMIAAEVAHQDFVTQQNIEKKRKKDEAERIRQAKVAAAQAAADLVAKGKALDDTKPTVRWEILDVDMFDGSLFKPLEEKLSFEFINAAKRIDEWVKFKLEGQRAWGTAMKTVVVSASSTFGILSNSGTDHKGWIFVYKKRKGVLRTIDKKLFKIKVYDNINGIEIPKTLIRPIIDIPPEEFWRLLEKAVLKDKLDGSKNASKKWATLKELHPNKSDEQILRFGFASVMYCLKQFPASRKMIKEVSEISTDVLSAEIKMVEPTFNRREMTIAMEISNGLYAEGKRQDTLLILDRMKTRFGTCDEWGEFKADFDQLFNSASKLKKK